MPQLYVMDADGANLRRLSDVWGEYPSWSPDGSAIAFSSYAGGTTPFGDPNYEVFVMDVDGGAPRNLTNDPDSYDGYPTWSPDGTRIAFQSTRGTPADFEPPSYDLERTSDEDIWVMDADGANARSLTNDLTREDSFPDWGPGRLIVFAREGSIVLLDPATGAAVRRDRGGREHRSSDSAAASRPGGPPRRVDRFAGALAAGHHLATPRREGSDGAAARFFVTSADTQEWEADPEVPGTEMHELRQRRRLASRSLTLRHGGRARDLDARDA